MKLEVTQEKIDEAIHWARNVVSGERRGKKEVERLAILLFCIEGEHDSSGSCSKNASRAVFKSVCKDRACSFSVRAPVVMGSFRG